MERILSKKTENSILINYFIGFQLVYPIIFGIILQYLFKTEVEYSFFLGNVISSILILLYVIYKCKDLLKNNLSKIQKGFIKKLFIRYAILLISVGVLNVSISFLVKTTSSNQVAIEQALNSNFLLTSFIACIFAPIVEEIIFREIIFKKFNAKFNVFIASFISSVLFGFVHIIPSLINGSYLEVLYIITYSTLGFILFNASYKDKNIISSIALHMLNNVVGVLLIFITMINV